MVLSHYVLGDYRLWTIYPLDRAHYSFYSKLHKHDFIELPTTKALQLQLLSAEENARLKCLSALDRKSESP